MLYPQNQSKNPYLNSNLTKTWSGISPTYSSFSPTTPAYEFSDSLENQFNNMNLGDQITLRNPSFHNDYQESNTRNFAEFHHNNQGNQYIELNDTHCCDDDNNDYNHHQKPTSTSVASQVFESKFFEQHQRSYTSFNLDTSTMESLGKSAIGDRRRARTLSSPVGLFENQRISL